MSTPAPRQPATPAAPREGTARAREQGASYTSSPAPPQAAPAPPRWATSFVPDNGKIHYGAGMPGSLCGCHDPKRRERPFREGVDCPDCLKIMRTRP